MEKNTGESIMGISEVLVGVSIVCGITGFIVVLDSGKDFVISLIPIASADVCAISCVWMKGFGQLVSDICQIKKKLLEKPKLIHEDNSLPPL